MWTKQDVHVQVNISNTGNVTMQLNAMLPTVRRVWFGAKNKSSSRKYSMFERKTFMLKCDRMDGESRRFYMGFSCVNWVFVKVVGRMSIFSTQFGTKHYNIIILWAKFKSKTRKPLIGPNWRALWLVWIIKNFAAKEKGIFESGRFAFNIWDALRRYSIKTVLIARSRRFNSGADYTIIIVDGRFENVLMAMFGPINGVEHWDMWALRRAKTLNEFNECILDFEQVVDFIYWIAGMNMQNQIKWDISLMSLITVFFND